MMIKIFSILFLICCVSCLAEATESKHDQELFNRVIPRFKVSGTVNEVLLALRKETIQKTANASGLNIVYIPADNDFDVDFESDIFAEPEEVSKKPLQIIIDFEGLTVLEIIKSICIAHDLRYKVENNIVSVMHPSEETDSLILKLYSVSLSDLKAFQGKGAQHFLESQGVAFNSRAQAKYIPSINQIIVSNTKSEQGKILECLMKFEVNEKLERLERKIESIKDNVDLVEELKGIKSLLLQNKKDKEVVTKKYKLDDKLNIIIPKIRMVNRDLEFFGDFIVRTTRDLHKDGEGLNLIIRAQSGLYIGRLNLNLDDVSVLDLIKFACKQLKLSYKIDENAVFIGRQVHSGDFFSIYSVSASFLSFVQKDFKGDFKKAIENFGVNFPVGTSISYLNKVQRIVVSNSEMEHKKLKEIFEFFKQKN